VTIEAAVLTFNAIKTGRAGYLASTLSSIRAAGIEPIVLTNGSVDMTDKLVRDCPRGIVDNRNSAMWYGLIRAIEAALESGPDIVVFSADDITYKDGWLPRLEAFWGAASDEIILAGLFIEDLWSSWNQVRAMVEVGGEKALVRDSVPSASWTFRARDWPVIRDVIPQRSPGEDLHASQQLRALGYQLVQMDLATHSAPDVSAWGNQSHLRPDRIPAETVMREWGLHAN
jgi:hypothetical protein